jgi:DNA-binding transcriptional ArsR family regulator
MSYLTDWLITMPSDPLSTTFAALADPTRRAILARLALGETSVTELAEPFAMSLPAISKHLKVLEHAGLILRGREAQWRPCRIAPVSLREVDGWLGGFRRFWDENFGRLDDYLEELKAKEAATAPAKRKVRAREKQRGRKSE